MAKIFTTYMFIIMGFNTNQSECSYSVKLVLKSDLITSQRNMGVTILNYGGGILLENGEGGI